MCVRDADDRCVLQFTLRNAAGCALHRRASRVIHRSELSLRRRGDASFASPEQRTAGSAGAAAGLAEVLASVGFGTLDDGVRRGGSPDLHASRGHRETAILAASAFHGLTVTTVPALRAHAKPFRQARFCARPSCRPRMATPRPTASSESVVAMS